MKELELAAAAFVAAVVKAVQGLHAGPGLYTSRALPPDCPSRRQFHRVVRTIPAAKKRGRVWVVPVADWEAHRRQGRRPKEDEADRLIAAAGFRATRRA